MLVAVMILRLQPHGIGSNGGINASTIESVEITWPVTGKKQILKNVRADQVLDIFEE